ncbi:MAG: type II toxin-antitoxin system YoeB family toxin [Methylococcales bacterium]|nr:type II toxin-antitoxin system YoeB family toxin [Methylococcales bacterium]
MLSRWSRRINSEHRLVYEIDGNIIKIIACRFHYD